MTKRATTSGSHYLFGGGLSLLVHVAIVLGFPAAPTSEPAVGTESPGLVWLEPGPGAGSTSEGGVAASEAPSAAPARAHRSSSRGPSAQAATLPTAPSEPTSPHSEGPATAEGGADTGEALAGAGATAGAGALGAGPTGGPSGAGGRHGGGEPVSGPRLLASGNPCAGYFPASAQVAHGRVQVEVEVGVDGRIASTRVMAEQPLGEGFAGAARACADRLLFTPAHTSRGTPVEGHARLLLSFDRS